MRLGYCYKNIFQQNIFDVNNCNYVFVLEPIILCGPKCQQISGAHIFMQTQSLSETFYHGIFSGQYFTSHRRLGLLFSWPNKENADVGHCVLRWIEIIICVIRDTKIV